MQKFGPYPTDNPVNGPLPDPLVKPDGTRVSTAEEWMDSQRNSILDLLKKYEYGEVLPPPDRMEFELLSRKENALGGIAVRKEVRITCIMDSGKRHSMELLLYTPRSHAKPVPAFTGMNFAGNHNTTTETDVRETGYRYPGELVNGKRAVQAARWSHEKLVKRGYASATMCYFDIHPDVVDGVKNSVFHLFFTPEEYPRIREKYSVIGAWAWGLSRMMDYLETDPDIDAGHVAVHGHSRMGKTALWAGAVDPRFAFVIASCSGCGGGALHKRKTGENLSQHFQAHVEYYNLPIWFVDAAEQFVWHEENMPFDQHELLAMTAPRPLAVGTAMDDVGDPASEFEACRHASPVYRLFGLKGLTADVMPPPDTGITGDISFHAHSGPHDQTEQDWERYLDLADRFLRPR